MPDQAHDQHHGQHAVRTPWVLLDDHCVEQTADLLERLTDWLTTAPTSIASISSASVFLRARIGLNTGIAMSRDILCSSGWIVVMTTGSLRSNVSSVMSSSRSNCSTNFKNAALPMTSTRSV